LKRPIIPPFYDLDSEYIVPPRTEASLTFQAFFTLLYAVSMGGGGWAGWRFARSLPSLLGGVVVGGLALVGSLLMFNGNETGRGMALLGAVLAALFFGWRISQGVLRRQSFGRAGGILFLSLLEVAVLLFAGSAAP